MSKWFNRIGMDIIRERNPDLEEIEEAASENIESSAEMESLNKSQIQRLISQQSDRIGFREFQGKSAVWTRFKRIVVDGNLEVNFVQCNNCRRYCTLDIEYYAASIFDPAYRKLKFLDTETKNSAILEIENSIFDILLLFGKEFDGSAHISERIIENSNLIRKYHNEVHICIDQEFYTPFEIISKIFYQLRRLASIPEVVSINATVVYPFNYDEQVLEELKISFTKTLNIKVVGFLNRDIAIAYNHFNQNRVEIKSRTILTVHCNSRVLAFSLFQISQDPHQLEIVWTAQSLIHGIYDGFRDALLKFCVNKFRQYFQEDLQEHDLKKPVPLRCWRVKKLENLRKQNAGT
ncbi:unnamed protein product [Allacma fusca]|uniref:Uncharacterized protein n=1 Tax=Allacma fusca TaxID=39272 RepID=A0A8J2KI41_9HEXA|nr:unnamed protein product [Allacma fusca]